MGFGAQAAPESDVAREGAASMQAGGGEGSRGQEGRAGAVLARAQEGLGRAVQGVGRGWAQNLHSVTYRVGACCQGCSSWAGLAGLRWGVG